VPSCFHVHRCSPPFSNSINHTPRDTRVIHAKSDTRVNSRQNCPKARTTKSSYSAMPDLTAVAPPPVIATSRRSQSARPRPRSAGWGSKRDEEIHRRSHGDESRDSGTEELAKFFSSTPPPWEDEPDTTGGGQRVNRSRSKISRAALNLFRVGGPLTFRRGDYPRQQDQQANVDLNDILGSQFFVQRTAKNSGKKYRYIKPGDGHHAEESTTKGMDAWEMQNAERDGDVIVLPSEAAIAEDLKQHGHGHHQQSGLAEEPREGLGIQQSHPHLVVDGLRAGASAGGAGVKGSSRSPPGSGGTPAGTPGPGPASQAKGEAKHGSARGRPSSNQSLPVIPAIAQLGAVQFDAPDAERGRGDRRDNRGRPVNPSSSDHTTDPATSSSPPKRPKPTHANFKLTTNPKAADIDHGFPSNPPTFLTISSEAHAATCPPDTRTINSPQLANAAPLNLTPPSQSDKHVVSHLAALAATALPPRTSSKKNSRSTTSRPLDLGPIDLNRPLPATVLPLNPKVSSGSPARDKLSTTTPHKSAIPDGLSLRSSMQSGTESVTEGHSDTSSAVVMDAEEKKLYQAEIWGVPPNGSTNPPNPGPAPTRDLPSLPAGYDRSGGTNRSKRGVSFSDGSPIQPPPRSPMREVVANTDPSGRRTPISINTASMITQSQFKSPTDPTSATSHLSMLSASSQSRKGDGARTEKVRALKARDLSSIRARYENKKLEESQALEEAAKEGEKLINDPSVETPKSLARMSPLLLDKGFGPKSTLRHVSSSNTLNVGRTPARRQNAISPVFLVMEQEPTTGRYRTGGVSPCLPRRERSVRSHVTSNGTHTPPRSASPSLQSSDDEGYGTQGVSKTGNTNKAESSPANFLLQQRRQNHPATPVTPGLNIDTAPSRSSTGTDTDILHRLAELERSNRFLEEALLAVIKVAGATSAGVIGNNPSPRSSAGAARRPESGLSAVSLGSLGSMSASGGDRVLEALINCLQGQKE
jgi:hypothetical protein